MRKMTVGGSAVDTVSGRSEWGSVTSHCPCLIGRESVREGIGSRGGHREMGKALLASGMVYNGAQSTIDTGGGRLPQAAIVSLRMG